MAGVALVLPGGGSRTFYLSGVLTGAGLRPQDVSSVYALSTAAPLAAYFVTGQMAEAGPVWMERLVASKFLDWSRLLLLRHPADVQAFIHKGCASLDAGAVPQKTLYVSTLRLRDGVTVCHEATAGNVRDLLAATCSFPIVAPAHTFNGDFHMDGGTEETFPVLTAHKRGARKIIAIATRPASYRMEPYGWFARLMTFPRWQQARAALSRRALRFAETRAFLDHPPEGTDLLLIQPEQDLPAGRLTTDPDLIRKTFDLGVVAGEQHRRLFSRFTSR